MRAARFVARIAAGFLLACIGVYVSWPAWEVLRFWVWCYSTKAPCAVLGLNYHILGLNFSIMNELTAQALLNTGLDIAVLGFALTFLAIVGPLTRWLSYSGGS